MSSNHPTGLGAVQNPITTTANEFLHEYELMFVTTDTTTAYMSTSTQVVALKSRGKTVAHAALSDLEWVMRKPWMASSIKPAPNRCAGLTIHIYEMAASERVVRFFGEMTKSWTVGKALVQSRKFRLGEDPTDTPDVMVHFCLVINHFANMSKYNSDIHDSLIDWFILWLGNNTNKDFNKALNTCMSNDIFAEGGLIRVCANVFDNHREELFTARNQTRFNQWLQPQTKESVKHTIPGDVLSSDFTDWCAYHHHGNEEVCYLKKPQY